jgi:hypothetical protein
VVINPRGGAERHPPQGLVLWRGPSLIDGKPVACVATGLAHPSENTGTGPMVQSWILRSHVPPVQARQTGGDRSVCGDCLHRDHTCYVQVWREVSQVYRSLREGAYPDYEHGRHANLFRRRAFRAGSYGDPAAVPLEVWQRHRRLCGPAAWTGYTHRWGALGRAPEWQELFMASVDSAAQLELARSLGWSTFRVLADGEERRPDEFVCPKSLEGARRLTCSQCGACGGGAYQGRHTPAIALHGALPSMRQRFRDDPRRFSLPLVG